MVTRALGPWWHGRPHPNLAQTRGHTPAVQGYSDQDGAGLARLDMPHGTGWAWSPGFGQGHGCDEARSVAAAAGCPIEVGQGPRSPHTQAPLRRVCVLKVKLKPGSSREETSEIFKTWGCAGVSEDKGGTDPEEKNRGVGLENDKRAH